MFATLLETRAIRQRRTVSSITSILLHGVVIGGATIVTARDTVVPVPVEPPIFRVDFRHPTSPPPVDPRPRQVGPATVTPSPFTTRIHVPLVVPVGIPSIDMSASTPVFTYDRLGTSGVICERDCATPVRTDSGGRALWTSNDLTMRLASEPVPPRYPESLRRAGVEGDVVVKFVVDTTGMVEMQTVEIVRSTHDAFTAAARETLARLRFFPSTVGERKVKALAVMPFRFTLQK